MQRANVHHTFAHSPPHTIHVILFPPHPYTSMADEPPATSHQEAPIRRERHTIASKHDLVLAVKGEWTHNTKVEDERAKQRGDTPAIHEFGVSREVLLAFPYFKILLAREYREAKQQVVELKEDDPRACKVWLQILHGSVEKSSYEVQTITIWHVLLIAEKYGFDPTRKDAQEWFGKWIQTQKGTGFFTDQKKICEILFPCHAFDNVSTFATCTEWLAYNSAGHISESRPAGFTHTHLRLDYLILRNYRPAHAPMYDCRIADSLTEQVNSARGRLKTILHRGLYSPIDDLVERTECPLWEFALGAYHTALHKTKAWPLERYASRVSIARLMQSLKTFKYKDPHNEKRCKYQGCGHNFKSIVDQAIRDTGMNFDGLCLGEHVAELRWLFVSLLTTHQTA
jgi:hypothetical protein